LVNGNFLYVNTKITKPIKAGIISRKQVKPSAGLIIDQKKVIKKRTINK
jgi:hypothetical protein